VTVRLTVSPDARVRVQQRSQKELRSFFDEIPVAAMRPLVPFLPQVDGFRRGSQAGIVKQKEALVRRLNSRAANEKDYNALIMLWRTWIDETQPNAPLIQRLIDELEEAFDKADGPEARKLVVEQRTDSLLRKLKEESDENRSTREGIERLFTYSPLPETAAARDIIASAKLAADVAGDAAYRNLPTRLDQDEREIKSIKAELKGLTDRVAAIADECTKAICDLPALRDAIRVAQSSADAARAAVDEKANKPAQDDSLKVLAEATRELEDTQTKSNEVQKQQASRIDHIAASLAQASRDVDALLEDRTQADRIAPLAEQIAALAQRVDAIAARPKVAPQIDDTTRHSASISGGLRWTSLATTGKVTAISSFADLATAFVGALLPLGIRKSGAQLLAEECAAAIAARQAIFLQGAFASQVAQALAVATGGCAGARVAMPLGMLDGGQLRLAVDEAFASLDDGVGGLVIEGVNHVPFDLVREIIADCVGPATQPGAFNRRIAVFATLSRGVASLPIEPETLVLGPVFDLDFLDWRTNSTAAPLPQASFFPVTTDQAIFAQLASGQTNVEEAVRLAQALVPKRNPSVERSIVRAYQALHLIRTDQKTVAPLHSLFYGWLLPYWSALGLTREQVDSEFDGGKVHGASLDGRLTAMFAAEFADSKEDGKP